MTSCSQLADIEALVYGEIDASRVPALRAHVDDCAACQDELETLSAERALFSQRAQVIAAAEPPPPFASVLPMRPSQRGARVASGIVVGNRAQPAGEDAATRGLPGRRLHRDAAGRRQEREVQEDEGGEIGSPADMRVVPRAQSHESCGRAPTNRQTMTTPARATPDRAVETRRIANANVTTRQADATPCPCRRRRTKSWPQISSAGKPVRCTPGRLP